MPSWWRRRMRRELTDGARTPNERDALRLFDSAAAQRRPLPPQRAEDGRPGFPAVDAAETVVVAAVAGRAVALLAATAARPDHCVSGCRALSFELRVCALRLLVPSSGVAGSATDYLCFGLVPVVEAIDIGVRLGLALTTGTLYLFFTAPTAIYTYRIGSPTVLRMGAGLRLPDTLQRLFK